MSSAPLDEFDPDEEFDPDDDGIEDQPADEYTEAAADLTATISRLLHEGNYIDAVIYARDRGGLGVKQARGVVEHIAISEGLRIPRSGCAGLANLLVIGTLTTLASWLW